MLGHTWNQVYLDGKWYNCDITNDADFIREGLKAPFFLKSNDEFGNEKCHIYTEYSCSDLDILEDAKESVSDEMQEELINEQRQNIINKKKSNKDGINYNQDTTFLDRLKNFLNRNKERVDIEK